MSDFMFILFLFKDFTQLAIKQKMIDSDEEFKEPNKLVQGVILMVLILIVVLAIGIYCFQKD